MRVPAGVLSKQAYCIVVAPLMTSKENAQVCLQNAYPSLPVDSAMNLHHNASRTKAKFLEKMSSAERPTLVSRRKQALKENIAPSASSPAIHQLEEGQRSKRQMRRLLQEAEERGARKQNTAIQNTLGPFAAFMAYVSNCRYPPLCYCRYNFFGRYDAVDQQPWRQKLRQPDYLINLRALLLHMMCQLCPSLACHLGKKV